MNNHPHSGLDVLTEELDRILRQHLGSTCTAAVVRVVDRRRTLVDLALGCLDPEQGDEPVTAQSPFDLASLTKLFTGAAVLRLAATGALELDRPVPTYLPAFAGPGKEAVSVRRFLTHSSGLPPFIRLNGPEVRQNDPWPAILACPLESKPGKRVVYSDVGFMVLGRLLEAVTGQALRSAMHELVLDPLRLHGARYGPCPGAPATELDPQRGRRVQGEVHDENAAMLGGAAGHAGLFAPSADVIALTRAFADPECAFLPPQLARAAIYEQATTEHERRGLAWKLRSPHPDSPERTLSPASFGHFGFTGTAVWTDPARDITVTLLTNRVYFGRDPAGITQLRSQVFATVSRAFPPYRPGV